MDSALSIYGDLVVPLVLNTVHGAKWPRTNFGICRTFLMRHEYALGLLCHRIDINTSGLSLILFRSTGLSFSEKQKTIQSSLELCGNIGIKRIYFSLSLSF